MQSLTPLNGLLLLIAAGCMHGVGAALSTAFMRKVDDWNRR